MPGKSICLFKKFKELCVIKSLFRRKGNGNYDTDATQNRKKPKHGSRYLVESRLFDFNAWDDVAWSQEQEQEALEKIATNSKTKVNYETVENLEKHANKHWDSFYGIHQNRFFKDRNWLFTEFPELNPSNDSSKGLKIFEIGCGVGNTVFPILRQVSPDQNVFVYACDFSETAINILKESPEYDPNRAQAFVLDATADDWNPPFEPASLDIIVLIFALSAINPEKFENIAKKMFYYLAPGGRVLFRDYGRYDLAQLRFKDGQCLNDNFYVRGDKTRVYFFTQEDMKNLFENAGFIEDQNAIDRRLQVNRSKMLKMYRVWIQGKYKKPL